MEMVKQAIEKFAFKPTGPYRIQKEFTERDTEGKCISVWMLLVADISLKRDALSDAKRFLENGNFEAVRVLDANNNVVFEKRQTNSEALQNDARFMGMVRILASYPRVGTNIVHAVCAMLKQEYSDKFPVARKDEWAPDEDEALRILIHLGVPGNERIGEILGRTESAVTHRAKRIHVPERAGIKRDKIF
jgi:hypothetical protein